MTEGTLHTDEQMAAGQEPFAPPQTKRQYVEYVKVVIVTVLVAILLKTFVVEAYRIPSGSMENTLLIGDFLIVNKLAYGVRTPSHVPFTNVAMPTLRIPLFTHIHRGDVVVFEYPGSYSELLPHQKVNYVKRSIGIPGDTVRIVHGRVSVNGATLDLPPYAKAVDEQELYYSSRRMTTFPPGTAFTQYDYGPIVVPKLGDTLRLDDNSVGRWKMLIEREGHSVLVDERRKIFIDGLNTDRYIIARNYYFMLGDNRDNSLDSRYWGFVPADNVVGEALLVYWSWDTDSSTGSAIASSSSVRWNRIGTIIR